MEKGIHALVPYLDWALRCVKVGQPWLTERGMTSPFKYLVMLLNDGTLQDIFEHKRDEINSKRADANLQGSPFAIGKSR